VFFGTLITPCLVLIAFTGWLLWTAWLDSLGYHVLIRKETQKLQSRYLGKNWADFEPTQNRGGMKLIHSNDSQYLNFRSYMLQEGRYVSPGGLSHDLIADFDIDNGSRDTKETGKIRGVRAGLLTEPQRPFSAFVAEASYPEGSVLDLLLHADDVRQVGEEFPVLTRLELTYDLIHDRWADETARGFHIRIEFAIDAEQQIGGKTLSLTAESGLDPLETHDGKKILAGFKPKDSVSSFRNWGGSEWWHGDKDAVKANQARFKKINSSSGN
jgi:hypothetical protein